MPAVFLDTAGLIAATSARDGLHAAAVRIRHRLSAERTPFVTSQWVLAEFLGSMSQSSTRAAALRTLDLVLASPRTTVVKADTTDSIKFLRGRAFIFAPDGAAGCSHGWSEARASRGERNPWEPALRTRSPR